MVGSVRAFGFRFVNDLSGSPNCLQVVFNWMIVVSPRPRCVDLGRYLRCWLAGSGKHWAVKFLQVVVPLTVGYVVRAVISKIVPSIRSYVDIGESSLDMVQVPSFC